MDWKKAIQHQKPMAAMLTALVLPTLMGVYTFGWRVLAVVLVANLTCYIGEHLFLRQQQKPVTMAALVTATLFALVLPPNVPFWIVILGAAFSIVFGKMVFGGFGKNIFNPAMVGRCFLYVAFPYYLAGVWYGPHSGPAGGFTHWGPATKEPVLNGLQIPDTVAVDGISGATTFTATKKLNQALKKYQARVAAHPPQRCELPPPGTPTPADIGDHQAFDQVQIIERALRHLDVTQLFFGTLAGSTGETSAFLILVAFLFLVRRRALKWQLTVGPALGLMAITCVFKATGVIAIPLGTALLVNFLAGGTLFGLVFMTTEPVSAPNHKTAIWIYGILIGLFAGIIRTLSVFNAGLMFSILLGNMFAPLIDIACNEYDAWRKPRSPA